MPLTTSCVIGSPQLWPWHRELRMRGRKAVHFLRSYGRCRLEARQKELLAGEDVPQDLLTHLLMSAGKVTSTHCEYSVDKRFG